jgi:hypothetical protein
MPPRRPSPPPLPSPPGLSRPAAAHVRNAVARGLQAKLPHPTMGRKPAAHVQAALGLVQPKVAVPAPGGRPVAPHVQAAINRGVQLRPNPEPPGRGLRPALQVPAARSPTIQRMIMNFQQRDPFADIPDDDDDDGGSGSDASGSDASDGEEAPSLADTLEELDFDDLTTDDFRNNHVVTSSLLSQGETVARRRNKDVSTTILIAGSDREDFVEEIKEKTLGGEYRQVFQTTGKNLNTSDTEFLIAEYVKRGNKIELNRYGLGKIIYGVVSAVTVGGYMYTVTHIHNVTEFSALIG